MDSVQQLVTACEQGDFHSAQGLLDEGLAVDVTDDSENTPLMVAAANGHDQVARLLLMRGASVDKCNLLGWTAVMQASRHGYANILSLLLQHQVDVNATNHFGASALMLAARGGHLQVVRILVEAGADINGGGSLCEYTPLMAAAQQGHDAVLRLFLDRGCDVNYRTPSTGMTPLMLASLNGHMTTAQILIERGGDPNLLNVLNHTALAIASIRGKREVRGFLDRKTTNKPILQQEERKPDIIQAAKQGDIQRIRDLLDIDFSQRDTCSPQDGATPLMFAAMTGRLDIAQLLVDRGCDINKQDNISGWTALMQATYHGKKAVAIFLINVGADVTTQARNGCTAFDMASLIEDVDTELLRLLANKTMHINKGDKPKTNRNWSKQNGMVSLSLSPDLLLDDQPKSGLKGWLSRLSNRFRNLKIGRTFNANNTTRLIPLTLEGMTEVSHDLSIKQFNSSPKLTPKSSSFILDPVSQSMTSYETMKQETKKSAALYTLVGLNDINPPHSNVSKETLKPVIPPFLPPPSFDLDSPARPWRGIGSRAKTTLTGIDGNSVLSAIHERPMLKPMKFLQSHSNTNTSQMSPTNSAQFSQNGSNASPNSSGDYHATGLYSPPPSLLPLTSERNPVFSTSSHSRLFMPRKSTAPTMFRTMSNTTSPNSSMSGTSGTSGTSGSSSVTPIRSSRGKSTSSNSKGSTASTLTPSPSPTPGKYADDNGPVLDSVSEHDSAPGDELSSILKKLSLEKYQPIFEEQEVDMEAFLTLTDDDLTELGISHVESRKQILTEISELNTGKARDRRQFYDTMTSFQSSLIAKQSSDNGSSCSNTGPAWLKPVDIEHE